MERNTRETSSTTSVKAKVLSSGLTEDNTLESGRLASSTESALTSAKTVPSDKVNGLTVANKNGLEKVKTKTIT